MSSVSNSPADTKDRLLDAAQRLFARDGVQGARIREINELAGQRNPSALHYHFGSRLAVVEAILARFQLAVDAEAQRRLDDLERTGIEIGIREVIEAEARCLVATLHTQAGRDCVCIIPQMLPALSRNLRRGVVSPATPHTQKLMAALDDHMVRAGLPEPLRRERLVAYAVVFTTLLGERAHHLEGPDEPLLDADAFCAHLVDTLVALLTAPATGVGQSEADR